MQTRRGEYLGFYWQQAPTYSIPETPLAEVSQWFRPCDPRAYQQLLDAVLSEGFPQRSIVAFTCAEYVISFDLTLTPIADANASCHRILGLGRFLSRVDPELDSYDARTLGGYAVSGTKVNLGGHGNLLSRISYPRFLTHIARKIRQTLNFETVWKQAAEGLNDAFNLSACHIFTFEADSKKLCCIAALGDRDPELLDEHLSLDRAPDLARAVEQLTPTMTTLQRKTVRSRFTIATSHQGTANGIIVLEREIEMSLSSLDTARVAHWPGSSHRSPHGHMAWSPIELEIIDEIANQVGTAAAHATLYRELEAARLQAEAARAQAQELSQLKSEFLANTSHELRTPLNGMMGFLKLILDGMTDDLEEQTEFIEEAYRSAVHLLNIINDILDVAKIEAGKMELDFEPVNLAELLNHLRDFTQSQIQEKNLSFKIEMPRTDDAIVLYGNYQRLLQVLLNLVGNAIKFTHEGGITVSCELLRRSMHIADRDVPGMVKIQVADTGIGISLDKQDRLFKSFSQVDGSRTRTYGGTGLGLVISQKLIETMGGEVNFFSMGEGLGSTVTFTAPLFQEPVFISTAESVDDILDDRESGESMGLPPIGADSADRSQARQESAELADEHGLELDLALDGNLDTETLQLAAELNLNEDGELNL